MGRNTPIKTETTDNFTQLVDNINNQSLDVGATGKLTTTVDSDIVGAINELDSDLGQLNTVASDIRDSNFAVSINNLNTKVNAGTAIDLTALDSVGNDSDTLRGGYNDSSERASLITILNTVSQDIQKLDSDINREGRLTTSASTLRGAINELDAEIGTISGLTTTNKSTVVASINELDAEIGAASLNTSATTLRGAINEHEADIASLEVFKNIATDSGSISITVDSANDTLTILGAGSLKTTGFENTVLIDHDVSAASSVNNSGNTFIQDITLDANGHITGIASADATPNDNTITLTAGTGINGGGDFTLNQSADSSISFSVDSDQRGIISSIGKTDSDYLIFDLKDSAADSDNMKIFFDNTEKFRFTGTGDLHVDNDIIAFSTTTASDERLKTNIETIENPIQKINRLRGATYHWKMEDKNQDSNMGLIAQEVERVLPFLVKENLYRQEIPLPDGSNIEDSAEFETELFKERGLLEKKYKTINYEPLIGLLIEGIKQLDREVRQLRKKIK